MANKGDQNDSGFGSNDDLTDIDLTPKRTKLYDDNNSNDDFHKGSSSSKRVFSVTFKEKIKHNCETSGRETIKNMVGRHLQKHFALKLNTENMVFKRTSDGCAINLGLPTNVLDDGDEYSCTSHNQEGRKADYSKMRTYNIGNYERSWKMGCFYIKVDRGRASQPAIGGLKNVAEKIRIDFFPKETLFESIIRDQRLKVENDDKLVAKRWYLKINETEIFLENGAHCYKDQCFTLHQKRVPDRNLPDHVPPLTEPEPDYNGAAMKSSSNHITPTKPSNSYQDDGHEETESPFKSATSSSKTVITCDKDLEDFLKKYLKIDVQKQVEPKIEKNRISTIRKVFANKYNQFALTRGNVRSVSKVKDLTKMFDSVGAVVFELDSGEEVFKGTCFVIGSQYVITNRHVIDSRLEQAGFKDFYVDFQYEYGCHGYRFRFSPEPVVSSPIDFELDYAILELREPERKPLPPSLTKCGYVIPSIDRIINAGDWLTLVGFPQHADGKVMEDACPFKTLPNLDENMVLALSRQNPDDYKVLIDTRRQTYDTGAFFHGSSGSPGVLMNEKLLVILHCRGFSLQDGKGSFIEQGVRMSAIRDDVDNKIKDDILPGYTLNELFDIPLNPKEEPMEIVLDL